MFSYGLFVRPFWIGTTNKQIN